MKNLLRGDLCEADLGLSEQNYALCNGLYSQFTKDGLYGLVNYVQMKVERLKDSWDYSLQDFNTLAAIINHEDWMIIM